jgi:hypothetical protein
VSSINPHLPDAQRKAPPTVGEAPCLGSGQREGQLLAKVKVTPVAPSHALYADGTSGLPGKKKTPVPHWANLATALPRNS